MSIFKGYTNDKVLNQLVLRLYINESEEHSLFMLVSSCLQFLYLLPLHTCACDYLPSTSYQVLSPYYHSISLFSHQCYFSLLIHLELFPEIAIILDYHLYCCKRWHASHLHCSSWRAKTTSCILPHYNIAIHEIAMPKWPHIICVNLSYNKI